MKLLSVIPASQPHTAYIAYIQDIISKWSYLSQTILGKRLTFPSTRGHRQVRFPSILHRTSTTQQCLQDSGDITSKIMVARNQRSFS